jgi:DNA-binding NtrC family response regulator
LLGKDYAQAMRKAIDLAADRDWTVSYFNESRGNEKPYWLATHLMRAYQAAERDGLDGIHRALPFINVGEASGESALMKRTIALAHNVAASDATVLIRGESGTGRGVLAQAIHLWSSRAAKPFATVSSPWRRRKQYGI